MLTIHKNNKNCKKYILFLNKVIFSVIFLFVFFLFSQTGRKRGNHIFCFSRFHFVLTRKICALYTGLYCAITCYWRIMKQIYRRSFKETVEQLKKKKGQVVNISVMPSAYVYIHASVRRNNTKIFFILRFVGMGMLCIVYSIQLVKTI